jgi:hypothetical protein
MKNKAKGKGRCTPQDTSQARHQDKYNSSNHKTRTTRTRESLLQKRRKRSDKTEQCFSKKGTFWEVFETGTRDARRYFAVAMSHCFSSLALTWLLFSLQSTSLSLSWLLSLSCHRFWLWPLSSSCLCRCILLGRCLCLCLFLSCPCLLLCVFFLVPSICIWPVTVHVEPFSISSVWLVDLYVFLMMVLSAFLLAPSIPNPLPLSIPSHLSHPFAALP